MTDPVRTPSADARAKVAYALAADELNYFASYTMTPGTPMQEAAANAVTALRRAALASTAQQTVEMGEPFGWVRIAQAGAGPESLQPWFIYGPTHPPYPARYRPLYAAPQPKPAEQAEAARWRWAEPILNGDTTTLAEQRAMRIVHGLRAGKTAAEVIDAEIAKEKTT